MEIVIATLVKDVYPLPGVTVFIWSGVTIVLATILAMVVRRLRGATLAGLGEGRILWSLVVTRLMFLPPPFILLVLAALASAFQLGFASVLWLATFYSLLCSTLISLLATLAINLAASIRGPDRGSPSGG